MIRRTGHRVTNPDPLGKGTPDNASNTELFPQLWSPITQICEIFEYRLEATSIAPAAQTRYYPATVLSSLQQDQAMVSLFAHI
mmetsp:Transcript_28491/g.94361  ORF Transcript_28491/g.94361 Transcript_28491/m.94361 type:complete len:83 (+) Transcript_28491:2256-2504(+)